MSGAREEIREVLGSLELLGELGEEALDGLVDEAELVTAAGGELLFRRGDPGDAMYLVVSGRLRVSVPDARGDETVLGEMGRGQPLGELALLTGEPRSASVRALRDTRLVRISRTTFDRFLDSHPATLRRLSRVLAGRLSRTPADTAHPARISVIAVAPLHPGRRQAAAFAAVLTEQLAKQTPVLYADAALLERELGRDANGAGLRRWLATHEAAGRLLLLDLAGAPAALSAACLGQADRLLRVAEAGAEPARESSTQPSAAGSVREELVLLHADPAKPPRGSADWLALHPFEACHHLRPGAEDAARLARHLLGRALGLVLGGGGARGFAHIGVLRAFRDCGIAVDRIGGSSFGGIMAAQHAAGFSPEHMLELNREEWNRHRIDRDYTLPRHSLFGSRRQSRILARMFGDACIEDLWIPFFCVTVNLTRCELAVHRRGPLAHWVHATASPPALQPPVCGEHGELFVDGGVLDNLPVGVMRRAGPGPVVAVNVSRSQELRAGPGGKLPNLVKIIYRTAKVTGLQREEESRRSADLVIEPPLDDIGLTDYAAIERSERSGYEHACQALAGFAGAATGAAS